MLVYLRLADESHTTDGEAISREEAIAHVGLDDFLKRGCLTGYVVY